MYKPDAPVFLNLLKIHMPVTAIVSILHRLSGLLLFLILPFFIYALQESLRSPASFIALLAQFDSTLLKIISLIFVWSFFHHLFSGLRFLLLDVEVGIEKQYARATALLVNILAVVTTLSIIIWSCS